MQQSKQQRWSTLLQTLQSSNDETEWFEAGTRLSYLKNKRAIKPLIKLMFEGKHELQREMAGYALAGSHPCGESKHIVTFAFTSVLLNKNESSRVRGQAAEGLGCIHGYTDKRNRAFKIAKNALLEALKDEEADVLFWSAYALGVMNVKEAVGPLKKLMGDERHVKSFWTVGQEASDVIHAIETGIWPDRVVPTKNEVGN